MPYLTRAKFTDLSKLKLFLTDNSLPTVGLEVCYDNFFIATEENSWVGVTGVEIYNQCALLRSVAVREPSRGHGHGKVLVEAVLSDLNRKGTRVVYLFIGTAEGYFKRFVFESIDQDEVDERVKRSPEFTGCCRTAQAMRKTL